MVSSPILTPISMRIPDAVHPPIPGQSHRYYGNIHIKHVKLPPNSQSLRGGSSYPRYTNAEGLTGNDLSIHDATAAGNMERVKELLDPQGSGETTSSFLLANEASPSSGLTPLHYAASRGHFEIVKWLIDAAGAIVDLEDQTGETALLKASYNGHTHVVAFLLQKHAKYDQKDNDGWTALHNASAQGYLQIVKYLLEHTAAEVDVRSSKGHTPLMNAASKGHIDIVEYLLNRRSANPLIKNNFGETAYDIAAISQEVYICELLEKAEREWWKGKKPLPQPSSFSDLVHLPATNEPYDIYAIHITVPIVLHENQRSSSVFGALSSLRGPPKYSSNNLLKNDVRGPWSLHPSGKPSSIEEIKLPSMSDNSDATSSKSSQNSWFWVTDWQVDMTHPRVDSQGWQYARSFEDSDKLWLVAPPSNTGSWVRRRRWVRVMKRVVDLSFNGQSYALQLVNDSENEGSNYVMKAEGIIKKYQENRRGKINNDPPVAGQLAKYKEAIEILSNGIKTDTNQQRKQEAASLINTFTNHAEYLENTLKGDASVSQTSPSLHEIPMTPSNITTPQPPIPISLNSLPTTKTQNVGSNSPHQPAPSIRSFETLENPWYNEVQSEDVGNSTQPSILENSVSPMRVHAQTGLTIANVRAQSSTTSGKWEDDSGVSECRRCRKKFGLWVRKHHCRRVTLPASQVLMGPSGRGDSSNHRVCDLCYQSTKGFSSDRRRPSDSSTMTECPACNVPLSKATQEDHLRSCLENNNRNGNSIPSYKYVGEQGDFSS
ncbi:6562_t:CDS:2 [Acaulospora morrowiae]|uniref:6562_t:CDS:1 n=1 Tax=Acaulospora morrowiae TaxID=94023 RepID=A0A9N8ZIM7_9GLOM|nr:6562_t:CDS:2 [Acaulospora morrowiae]